MMQTAILNFAKQFEYKPKIQNKNKLKKYKHFVILGMGGSHLAADVLRSVDPSLSLTIHSDYGLPSLPVPLAKETLFIACSYSGNTEEVMDAVEKAREKKYALATLSVGGSLLQFAHANNLPHIQLPDTNIQPRSALGFSIIGILALMGQKKLLAQAHAAARSLKPKNFEKTGKTLAQKLNGKVPIIYSSQKNFAVAYNWKIKMNETGKIPAFYNVLPELNHNEMNGFDVQNSTNKLSENFLFLFIKDSTDHPKNKKRMEILKKLYVQRGLTVETIELKGTNPFVKIFSCLLVADWTAVHIAEHYGLEAEQVPMVEEFKKLIRK